MWKWKLDVHLDSVSLGISRSWATNHVQGYLFGIAHHRRAQHFRQGCTSTKSKVMAVLIDDFFATQPCTESEGRRDTQKWYKVDGTIP